MTAIVHIGTDQDWQNETTTDWYQIDGQDYGAGFEFDRDVYGIIDCNGETQVLDSDGGLITESDYEAIAVRNAVKIKEN